MDSIANIPNQQSLRELQARQSEVCISLYQPTHRHLPENRQDPIRYGNLMGKLKASLSQKLSEEAVKKILRPFHELEEDREFWNHTLDGIAVFASEDYFVAYTIPRAVPELAIVADSFHKKPLRKFLQSTDQYQLLALSLDEIELYQGNRYSLQRIEPGPDVPKTIGEALGRDVEEEHPGTPPSASVRGGKVMINSGSGGGKDERAIDQTRWFRAVDAAINEHVSKQSHLPLILVALTEHHGEFRKISQNSYLHSEGIQINPKAVKLDELKKLAWKVMEPKYHAYLDGMKDNYLAAAAKDQGSDKLETISEAAVQGKVATLFIEETKILPGSICGETGAVKYQELANPAVDDILDDLGSLVERNNGKVFLIPGKHMPTETGLAAIYRF